MKLWNVKVSECVKSFEAYDSDAAVWALAVDTLETKVVTGANTSTIIVWKVCSCLLLLQLRCDREGFFFKEV
jgi:hypothetical protein